MRKKTAAAPARPAHALGMPQQLDEVEQMSDAMMMLRKGGATTAPRQTPKHGAYSAEEMQKQQHGTGSTPAAPTRSQARETSSTRPSTRQPSTVMGIVSGSAGWWGGVPPPAEPTPEGGIRCPSIAESLVSVDDTPFRQVARHAAMVYPEFCEGSLDGSSDDEGKSIIRGLQADAVTRPRAK